MEVALSLCATSGAVKVKPLFVGSPPSLNALKYADIAIESGTFHKTTEDGDYVIQMRGVTRTGGSHLTPPFTPTLPKGRNFN